MRPEAERWLAMADYDLDVARLCFDNNVYVYSVFFCHLALEKLLKSIILDRLALEEPPHTHNLVNLVEMVELEMADEDKEFIALITPSSVETRYAESFEAYSETFANFVLGRTQEVFEWLRSELM